jgi:hypothetical protein
MWMLAIFYFKHKGRFPIVKSCKVLRKRMFDRLRRRIQLDKIIYQSFQVCSYHEEVYYPACRSLLSAFSGLKVCSGCQAEKEERAEKARDMEDKDPMCGMALSGLAPKGTSNWKPKLTTRELARRKKEMKKKVKKKVTKKVTKKKKNLIIGSGCDLGFIDN